VYLILLGAPGAGKGTQADALATRFGLAHVASGDLFRENIGQGTPLGLEAKKYVDAGLLVPDDLTVAMVMERLRRPDCADGVVLDGFPRTLEQAQALDAGLQQAGKQVDLVLYIEVPTEVLLNRLAGRWLCRLCQTPYHELFSPPRVAGVCDKDGAPLYQRSDDTRETAQTRLQVYFRQTAPLIAYYRQRGLLKTINGDQSVEQVQADLVATVPSPIQG